MPSSRSACAAGRSRTATSSRRTCSTPFPSTRPAGGGASSSRRPGWTTFVAERDGEIVGFASVGPSRDERGLGELYAIYVDPDSWSQGAGRALVARAEEQLAGEYEEATLWVLAANPRARHFYERAGWLPDGTSKSEERLGVRAEELRYRKTLATSSRS